MAYKFITDYKCSCGKEFKKVTEKHQEQTLCWCNGMAEAVGHIDVESTDHRPHGKMYDLPSYQSPITGKWIDGRVARRNDLAASNCVEYDPGMETEQTARYAKEDAQLDKKVDEHVEKTILEMPTAKREKLVSELESSDIAVTRI